MDDCALNGREIDAYFCSLGEGRRELFWARFRRAMAAAGLDGEDFDDPAADAVFDEVLRAMWVTDTLARLAEMGVLTREVDEQGRLVYRSA